MATRLIDIHPHIISRMMFATRGAALGVQSDWSRERPVTIDDMIVAMDEAGVEKSAIVQASTCYGHDNSYLAESIASTRTALRASAPSISARAMLSKSSNSGRSAA